MRDEVAGDPIDGTRWTRKTTRSIAEELLTLGIQVSANTVGRLLRQMQFSLRTNRKNIESGIKRKYGDRARRNRQFILINAKRRKFETADLPIISVDRYGALSMASVGSYGWDGAYGSGYHLDPKERMLALLMIQLSPNDTDLEKNHISRPGLPGVAG